MSTVVSEQLHTGGLLIQLLRIRDAYAVRCENDDVGLWWPTMEGWTLPQVKAYVGGVLLTARHDCSRLGCAGWKDRAS